MFGKRLEQLDQHPIALGALHFLIGSERCRPKDFCEAFPQPGLCAPSGDLVQSEVARDPVEPESRFIARDSIHTRSIQSQKTLLRDFLGDSAPSDQALEKTTQSRVHLVEHLSESMLIALHIRVYEW